MHKRTVAIVLMATTTFTMIPFFWQWINFQYGRHLYADWSAWWSFGTFLLAVIAACLTWQEYHASRRPRLMVKLTKSYHHLVTGEIAESVHFFAENIGGSVAVSVVVQVSPGIPWPLGSHPAGDVQERMGTRKCSYLAPGDKITLLGADRGGFGAIAFDRKSPIQSVSFSYSDAGGHGYKEHYDIDLKDIAYISETKVDG